MLWHLIGHSAIALKNYIANLKACLNFTLYFTFLPYDSFRKHQVSVPTLSMHKLFKHLEKDGERG